jgi:hypothetical protein
MMGNHQEVSEAQLDKPSHQEPGRHVVSPLENTFSVIEEGFRSA